MARSGDKLWKWRGFRVEAVMKMGNGRRRRKYDGERGRVWVVERGARQSRGEVDTSIVKHEYTDIWLRMWLLVLYSLPKV